MKKCGLIVLFCATFLITQKGFAQVDVSVNPIGILFGNLSVGADFAVNENFSVEGTIGFGAKNRDLYKTSDLQVSTIGKYYFNPEEGADKFYIDAFLTFINRNYRGDESTFADFKSTRFGLGFGIGYKILNRRGFMFEIGGGLGRALYDKTSILNTDIEWQPIIGYGKLGIGWRFGGRQR
jgi:hypothetical protein